jgi:hypothetical protein
MKATAAVSYLLEATATENLWSETRTVIPYQAHTILNRLSTVDRVKYIIITTEHEAAAAEHAFWDVVGREVRTWAGLRSHRAPVRKGIADDNSAPRALRPTARAVAASQSRRHRRHREVMVLHDGDDAVSEQDIYQRL